MFLKNNFIKVKLKDSGKWIINLDYVIDIWYDEENDATLIQFLNEDEPRKISGEEVFIAIEKYSTKFVVLNESMQNGNEMD